MTYETLYDDFLLYFPDDMAKLQKMAEHAVTEPSDGMHIMFGMVVVPYLLELLEKNDIAKLRLAFSYFEKMAEADNTMISEVLEFTILEDLISRGKIILDRCKLYMGHKTLDRCETVEKYMM